jgi:predicted DCC family thiol-disulfide oxidoreductase YuxK
MQMTSTSIVRTPEGRAIVLFDGVCLLCNGFVHFVIDHERPPPEETGVTGSGGMQPATDTDSSFRHAFATLQSEVGMSYLAAAGLPLDVSTVVLIDEDGVHTRSTAALRVLRHCGLPYSLLHTFFIWLPAPLRDLGYKAVAAMRYRLFGKDEGESTCRMMSKAIRPRFSVPKWSATVSSDTQ